MHLLHSYLQKTPENARKSDVIATLALLDHLREAAPAVAQNIIQELNDQRAHLKMIASENFSSLSVQLAMGNWLTDKYAEGFPHHRFYAGCEQIDKIEEMACSTLQHLFGADHAYVQPHSGADANLVAYWAILTKMVQTKELEKVSKKLDDLSAEDFEALRNIMTRQKLLGLSLNSGGHLTHGYRHNVSSKFFQSFFYEVDPTTHLLDYDTIRARALAVRPLILLAGYSSYPRRINFRKMREIADEVGAILMVDMAHFAGLVAGKVFQGDENPIPFAHIVTSTTHKTLRGPRGGFILCQNDFKEFVDKGCPLVLGGPLPHVIAAKSIAFQEACCPSFQTYAHQVVNNARMLAQKLMEQGLKVLTNGTDNHLVVVDVSPFGITGRHAENSLRQVGITVNRNAIPYDQQGPWYTSGIRIGTAALTTRGMKEHDMALIAGYIADVLQATRPAQIGESTVSKTQCTILPDVATRAQEEVKELISHFPLYKELPDLTSLSLCRSNATDACTMQMEHATMMATTHKERNR